MSAMCHRWFTVLIAAIFAIVVSKPEIVKKPLFSSALPSMGAVVYWYFFIGVLGLIGFESLALHAKKTKKQISVPFVFLALFALYTVSGFQLLLILFGRLVGFSDA